jgi:hypothetical protein
MLQPRVWFLVGFLVFAVLMRLVPYILFHFGLEIDPETTIYPWNFSPLPALCLFGAAYFTQKRWAFFIPLAAYLLGDLGIWALTGRPDWAFYPGQSFVYGGMALTIVMGLYLRKNRSAWAIGGTGVAAAIMFFVISNFGHWAVGDTGMYTRDLRGLIECYVMALPFFRNSLISMILFSGILFSRLALVEEPAVDFQAGLVGQPESV